MEKTRIELLQEFLQADPNDSFSRYALGLEYLSAGQAAQAAETLEEVRLRDPDYLATYYQLGAAYRELGLPERAAEAWRLGLEVASRQADWHTHGELEAVLASL